jgi:hypothetical protein
MGQPYWLFAFIYISKSEIFTIVRLLKLSSYETHERIIDVRVAFHSYDSK